jgi:hypothetical protein
MFKLLSLRFLFLFSSKLKLQTKLKVFCIYFFKVQVPNKAQGFYFYFFQSSSSKSSKVFTKLVSLLCSSIGIGGFRDLGHALLMVFFFTLTKLTFFF